MTIIQAVYSDEIDKAIINSKDCEVYDLYEGDLIELINEETGNKVFCILSVFEGVPQESIALGQNIMDNLGITEEDVISISKCDRKISVAKKLEIEYESQDYDAAILKFDENFRTELVNYLRNYFFNPIYEIFWPEENARLYITFPELKGVEPPIKISDYNDEIVLKIKPRVAAMPFNAILSIDCSGSMHRRDIKFSNMSGVINHLIDIYDGDTMHHKDLKSFLDNLNPKIIVNPENYKITRIDATLLAILMFFNQKISRGLGEKCSILLYSGKSKVFKSDDKSIFDATDMTNIRIITNLKSEVTGSPDLQTNFTIFNRVFIELKDIFGEFSKISKNPIMVLFLTDGKPEPRDLDKPELIFEKIMELRTYAQEMGQQFVIYTLGIGEEDSVDSDILTKIAQLGYGDYHFTQNLLELTSWFENLAKEFSINLQKIDIKM
ncbi:MAG: hypothetical protein ACTSR3_12710 [Candidatus Helarchaeota archaeon]